MVTQKKMNINFNTSKKNMQQEREKLLQRIKSLENPNITEEDAYYLNSMTVDDKITIIDKVCKMDKINNKRLKAHQKYFKKLQIYLIKIVLLNNLNIKTWKCNKNRDF